MKTEANCQTKTDITVLGCARAMDMEQISYLNGFKLVRLPCSSKAEPAVILGAFEGGARGVLLIPCASESCQYVEGNLRAKSMSKGVIKMLSEIGIDPQRFAQYPLEIKDRTDIKEYLNSFVCKIDSLGDLL